MGTWSATIFGNDTSLDIKDEFFERYNLNLQKTGYASIPSKKNRYATGFSYFKIDH